MFIAIIGTRASGKSAVQQYLVSQHNFQHVRLSKHKLRSEVPGILTPPPSGLPPIGQHNSEIDGLVNDTTKFTDGDISLPRFFDTPADLLAHVTKYWRDSFVTCDLDTLQLIQQFNLRPFFLLVSVDAPLITRFQRLSQAAPNLTLPEFVDDHDTMLYGCETPSHGNVHVPLHVPQQQQQQQQPSLHNMFRLANIHIINSFENLTSLHDHLNQLNLTDPERLRPRWDTYFMTLAALASQRSNCMKRRVGAILVRDNRIVATGYNGTPRNVRNCNEGGCPRCNSGGRTGEALDRCLCLHAEENALLEAGRERVGAGSVLYCNTCPCLGCAIKIVQTGVTEVVYNLSYKVDDQTAALFNSAGVILRQHSPPQ